MVNTDRLDFCYEVSPGCSLSRSRWFCHASSGAPPLKNRQNLSNVRCVGFLPTQRVRRRVAIRATYPGTVRPSRLSLPRCRRPSTHWNPRKKRSASQRNLSANATCSAALARPLVARSKSSGRPGLSTVPVATSSTPPGGRSACFLGAPPRHTLRSRRTPAAAAARRGRSATTAPTAGSRRRPINGLVPARRSGNHCYAA
jgi:hypothetical protein